MPNCVHSNSLRRGKRSAKAPPSGVRKIIGSADARLTKPSATGTEDMSRTSQPCPTICIWLPTLDTSRPAHSARNGAERKAAYLGGGTHLPYSPSSMWRLVDTAVQGCRQLSASTERYCSNAPRVGAQACARGRRRALANGLLTLVHQSTSIKPGYS